MKWGQSIKPQNSISRMYTKWLWINNCDTQRQSFDKWLGRNEPEWLLNPVFTSRFIKNVAAVNPNLWWYTNIVLHVTHEVLYMYETLHWTSAQNATNWHYLNNISRVIFFCMKNMFYSLPYYLFPVLKNSLVREI